MSKENKIEMQDNEWYVNKQGNVLKSKQLGEDRFNVYGCTFFDSVDYVVNKQGVTLDQETQEKRSCELDIECKFIDNSKQLLYRDSFTDKCKSYIPGWKYVLPGGIVAEYSPDGDKRTRDYMYIFKSLQEDFWFAYKPEQAMIAGKFPLFHRYKQGMPFNEKSEHNKPLLK